MLSQNLNSEILVMQPASIEMTAMGPSFCRRRKSRRILFQGEMRPDLVVIGSVVLQNATQMRFV